MMTNNLGKKHLAWLISYWYYLMWSEAKSKLVLLLPLIVYLYSQCRQVGSATDKCLFSKTADSCAIDEGFVNYIQVVFCNLSSVVPIGIIVFVSIAFIWTCMNAVLLVYIKNIRMQQSTTKMYITIRTILLVQTYLIWANQQLEIILIINVL